MLRLSEGTKIYVAAALLRNSLIEQNGAFKTEHCYHDDPIKVLQAA